MTRLPRRRRLSRPQPLRLFLSLSLTLAACGPGAEDDARDTRGANDAPPSAATGDSTPTPAPGEQAARDSAASGTEPAERPAADAGDGWVTPPVRVEKPDARQAVLRDVRTARHEGYDRIVFEFEGEVPGHTILYRDPPMACGSGDVVDVGAPAALEVAMTPAVAHDEAGRITLGAREISPGLPVLRSARITCDFEGIVAWVLGLERRVTVRVMTLESPARLVVDLSHR